MVFFKGCPLSCLWCHNKESKSPGVEIAFAGDLQWQFNVITTDTLRDAMEHPEDYHWLLVRISGYNAYFTKINGNMQEQDP